MEIWKKLSGGILVTFVFCLFCADIAAADAAREFRIGVIGTNPGQTLQSLDPFARYLENELTRSGIRKVTILVAKDIGQMRTRLQEGALDFVLTTAYPLIELEPNNLLTSIIALQGAAKEYSTIFFVRKQNAIRDLQDLRGKTIVFGTPSSTSAYALAKAELRKNGLTVSESTDETKPAEAVRYSFAGETINQAFWIIRNRADAGVLNSIDWEQLPEKTRSKLRIIHRTKPIVHLIGSFHASVPPDLRTAVENALIDMHQNRKGRRALRTALNITGFERLTHEDILSIGSLKKLFLEAK